MQTETLEEIASQPGCSAGSVWNVTLQSADFSSSIAWDEDGAPDPYLAFSLLGQSAVAYDTSTPVWEQSMGTIRFSGLSDGSAWSTLRYEIFDHDGGELALYGERPAGSQLMGRMRHSFFCRADQEYGTATLHFVEPDTSEMVVEDTQFFTAGGDVVETLGTVRFKLEYDANVEAEPIGDVIYLTREDGLSKIWSVSSEGVESSEPLMISELETAYVQASPDGSRIAFVRSHESGEQDLFVRRIDSGQEQQLTTDGIPKDGLQWSPDSQRIAYVTRVGANLEPAVFVTNADGSGAPRNMTPGRRSMGPAWSPSGQYLAVASPAPSSVGIFIVEVSTASLRQLTPDYDGPSHNAVWSPDGQRLAYQHGAGGNSKIQIVEAETGAIQGIGPNGLYGASPVWHPSGREVVYHSDNKLRVVDVASAKRWDLAGEAHYYSRPVFSHDGSHVAFVTRQENSSTSPAEVYIMRSDGTNRVRATRNAAGEQYLSWTP